MEHYRPLCISHIAGCHNEAEILQSNAENVTNALNRVIVGAANSH